MSSLQTRLEALATAVGTDIKAVKAATGVSVTPSGLAVVTGTNVQSAIAQLDAEAAVSRRAAKPSFMRAGATAETFPRYSINGATTALVSGTMQLAAIELVKGDVVGKITFLSGNVAGGTIAHQYAALLNSAGLVLGTSTDKTNTLAIPTYTEIPYAITNPYTCTATGLFYVAWCVTATTMPQFQNLAGQNVVGLAPQLSGRVASQTTPPPVGSPLTITNPGQAAPWAWVSAS